MARPGTLRPAGVAAPFRIDDPTGLITVDAVIAGQATHIVLDAGAGYSWLRDVGALGTVPLLCAICDRLLGNLFWDTWQKNAPQPVAGWIGGNVLKDFRITIDYPNRTSYWLRQRAPDPHLLAVERAGKLVQVSAAATAF